MARNMKRDTIILIILGLSAAAFLGFAFFLTPKEPVKIPANNQITATSTVNIPVRIEEKIKLYFSWLKIKILMHW